jgi:hypothetical protein
VKLWDPGFNNFLKSVENLQKSLKSTEDLSKQLNTFPDDITLKIAMNNPDTDTAEKARKNNDTKQELEEKINSNNELIKQINDMISKYPLRDVDKNESTDVGENESKDVGENESKDVGENESKDVGENESKDVESTLITNVLHKMDEAMQAVINYRMNAYENSSEEEKTAAWEALVSRVEKVKILKVLPTLKIINALQDAKDLQNAEALIEQESKTVYRVPPGVFTIKFDGITSTDPVEARTLLSLLKIEITGENKEAFSSVREKLRQVVDSGRPRHSVYLNPFLPLIGPFTHEEIPQQARTVQTQFRAVSSEEEAKARMANLQAGAVHTRPPVVTLHTCYTHGYYGAW